MPLSCVRALRVLRPSLAWRASPGASTHSPARGPEASFSSSWSLQSWPELHDRSAGLQPWSHLCLAMSPVDLDPDTQTDVTAWPQTCLVTMDLPRRPDGDMCVARVVRNQQPWLCFDMEERPWEMGLMFNSPILVKRKWVLYGGEGTLLHKGQKLLPVRFVQGGSVYPRRWRWIAEAKIGEFLSVFPCFSVLLLN